ncbi:MAG: hypothetical protein JO257_29635 [Deltaproteobacteria bacterium]|nr:hypothetical protein [Deltaproteobacteria bacterium]
MRVAIVLIALLAAGSARADDGNDSKSPGTAAALSIVPAAVGTFAFFAAAAQEDPSPGVVLGAAVVVAVGPSLGHFYTGSSGIGLLGIAARVGGFAMYRVGAGECTDSDAVDECGPRRGQNRALEYAGLAVLFGGTAAQLIDAPLSAQRYNEEHRSVMVAPMVGGGTTGLALVGTF